MQTVEKRTDAGAASAHVDLSCSPNHTKRGAPTASPLTLPANEAASRRLTLVHFASHGE